MTSLSPVLNFVLGFSVVMAAVSMLVSMTVGMLHRIANRRGRQLAEMLAATNYAFRSHNGDYGSPDDEATAAFVKAVLDDAAVRSASLLNPARKGGRPVEFVALDDLTAIVTRLSTGTQLPRAWHVSLDKDLATSDNFISWLKDWYSTIEANALDRFRKESWRMVGVISAIAVVWLNLDALQLASDLFTQAALNDTLASHASGLVELADDTDNGGSSQDALGDFVQLNAIFNIPALRLGWQRSAFVEVYCTWRKECGLTPSVTKYEADVGDYGFAMFSMRWFVGLLISFALLLLGAPFWADRVRDVLRLRSSVEQVKPSPGSSEPWRKRLAERE